ncbi:MAG: hypothetical protein XU14_C0030G0009 [Armatimonadetes bacterium CSP1-3]|nr:MAG: hypothetical protein XU14_C0030G0009 [Armatimonadetes bacterium CSP1-3]
MWLPGLGVAALRRLDLPGDGRPMGGLVGFVIIDPKEIIRVQRVDIDLGSHSGQIRDIVQAIAGESTRR